MQSSAKIKVTHILTDSNIGGAGRLLRYFLEKADREHFEYSVILPEGAALIPEIEALGKTFDPNLHNAVMHVEDDNAGENEIVEVFMKGYIRGEKVLRYSMVKVAN